MDYKHIVAARLVLVGVSVSDSELEQLTAAYTRLLIRTVTLKIITGGTLNGRLHGRTRRIPSQDGQQDTRLGRRYAGQLNPETEKRQYV